MQTITLSKTRLREFATFIDSIPLKEFTSIKDVSLVQNTVGDLQKSVKEFVEKVDSFNEKRQEIFKKYKDELKTVPQEERAAKEADMNSRMQEEFQTMLKEEADMLDKVGEEEASCELSNDKHALAVKLFEGNGLKVYTDKKVYLEVAEALGLEL